MIPKLMTTSTPSNQAIENNVSQAEHIHDVHHCHNDEHTSINDRIEQARTYCRERGIRFTSLRELVYRLVLEADKPMGAYDLLTLMQQQALAKDNNSKNIAPPTVYRSLEFLLEVGFIHQLTSINAFVPCCHPREKHIAGFLICNNCQRVQECSNVPVQDLVFHTKNELGFAVERSIIEMTGLCEGCQSDE